MSKKGRDRIAAAATVVIVVVAGVLTVKGLDHPAEQPISGSEYREQIAAHAQRSIAVEQKAELPEQKEVVLYDVPLAADLQIHIIETCEAQHIDPAIVMAMAYRESGYNAAAIGDGGDSYGLLQIQPRWHYERMQALGCTDLLDPFQNVTVAVDYLAEQLARYDGDMAKALVAYNQGHFYETITDYALAVLDMAAELAVTA